MDFKIASEWTSKSPGCGGYREVMCEPRLTVCYYFSNGIDTGDLTKLSIILELLSRFLEG